MSKGIRARGGKGIGENQPVWFCNRRQGWGGRKEEEEFRSQGPRGTTVWEARVMGLQELVPPIT